MAEDRQDECVWDNGLLKSIAGFTWPGIEYGEPPTPKHTFFEYIDALRLGNIARFLEIEKACEAWWHPLLDRGAGAALHIAVAHGQMRAVRLLVEERGVEVNQKDVTRGWTPLHHCAYMAHHREAPYLAIFEYLLQQGADPNLLTTQGWTLPTGEVGPLLPVMDLVVHQGRDWQVGEVKGLLEGLISKYAAVAKRPPFTYVGAPVGPVAKKVMEMWERQPVIDPPPNWRPPPPAGYAEARGMRRVADEPWRPAGQDDGSYFVRPMTNLELAAQSQSVAAAVR